MFNIMNRKKSTRTTTIATRVVKTSRWVHRNELKVGMYVRELDCAWEDTPFMFQGFVIDNVDMLNDVQEVAEFVCIESEKLAKVAPKSTARLCGASR